MLLISILTLFAGPLLYLWLSRGGEVAQLIERGIVIALVVLVVVLLLPEIIEPLGWWSLALVAAGYFLPGLLETVVRRAAKTMHLASLFIALLGLLLHALLDGAGLAGSALQPGSGLATAIVLHRFGVGLMLWLIMEPAFGRRMAWVMLFGMAGATVLGFEFSGHLLHFAGEQAVTMIEAVIIGTIIHSLVYRGHVHIDEKDTASH